MPSSDFLKSVELRLLRCTISPSPPPPPPPPPPQPSSPNPCDSLRPLVESLLVSIEHGDYSAALFSPAAARLLFGFLDSFEFENSANSAARFYGEVDRSVQSFLRTDSEAWLQVLGAESSGDEDAEGRFALVLCLGVAALLAFTLQNLTGPVGDLSPFPLPNLEVKKGGDGKGGGEWDVWAQNQLTSVGSDLLGKFSLLQYIVYAQILLRKAKDLSREGQSSCLNGNRSISWWLCRLILLHQKILDELTSSLYDLLQILKNETLLQFGKSENVTSYWGSMIQKEEASTIASVAQLEAGTIEYKYGHVDSSRFHLSCAEVACGLNLSLTGALGFRTIHQVEAKAQMVLIADTVQEKHGDGCPKEISEALSEHLDTDSARESHSNGHYDYCDILMRPKLVEHGNRVDNSMGGTLTAAQQAVVLAQCLLVKRRSRDDELSGWEMAPYIEAIDAQEQSSYIIRSFCDILRIRWESTRSRTKQRALLMMDKLVEAVYEALPCASQRIQFAFGVYVPTISTLRKEYGELLVSCGMCGEAIKIFEDLELWDNLIYCYRLLEKKAAAVDLIKARLSDTPTDARLWCSLGDVTNNDVYYEKALEVSNNKSARAKRSLARSAYNRGDYEKSKVLWESAMAQNSLFPNGWFALGAAALKARDIDKALDGFTHAVQLDPENGEAWNNIACLHMIKKKSKESFVAFKEALKFRRTSWQLWENYSQVAFDVGSLSQALEAAKMVIDLSGNKRVDVELLDKIMRKVEEKFSNSALTSHVLEDHNNPDFRCPLIDSSNEYGYSESSKEKPWETELLMDMLGNILKQVIQNGGCENIWDLYARWHKIKGNLSMCSEALLKQVRSYQGSDLWHDRDRFKKFAHASLQLCKVYMEIASSTGSNRELTMAEMHLRSSVKQAVNFSETEEFRDLQACLDEVKKQLNCASTGSA